MKTEIESLVSRRQHSCRHMQKILSKEGGFWLNSIKINREDVENFTKAEGQERLIQQK